MHTLNLSFFHIFTHNLKWVGLRIKAITLVFTFTDLLMQLL